LRWLENQGDDLLEIGELWPNHFVERQDSEVMFINMADLNGDGDLKVMTCEQNYGPDSWDLGVKWYENPHVK
jgi:hypothetical protein